MENVFEEAFFLDGEENEPVDAAVESSIFNDILNEEENDNSSDEDILLIFSADA